MLVDKRGEYVFAPSLLWVMVGQRRPAQITKDLRRMLAPRRGGVAGRGAGAPAVARPRARRRAGPALRLPGGRPGRRISHRKPYPALRETAHNFFAFDGAARLWHALTRFEGGRALVLVSRAALQAPGRALTKAAMLLDDAAAPPRHP